MSMVDETRGLARDGAELAVTQRRVVRSEWIKLRSVRSWTVMALAAAVLMIAFGALAASVASGAVTQTGPRPGGGPFASTDPTAISLAGVSSSSACWACCSSATSTRTA